MTKYRQLKETPASVIAGEAAIVTQEDSRLHILNGVGTRIWELCDVDTGVHIDVLVAQLLEEYDVTDEMAREETIAFLQLAIDAGVIEAI